MSYSKEDREAAVILAMEDGSFDCGFQVFWGPDRYADRLVRKYLGLDMFKASNNDISLKRMSQGEYTADIPGLVKEIKMSKIQFRENDKTGAYGLIGKVESVDIESKYPIKCEFETKDGIYHASFTLDGRADPRHEAPSLVLLERLKVVAFEDWENEEEYRLDGIGPIYKKVQGLPYHVDRDDFATENVMFFVDNDFYEVESWI